MDIDFRQYAHRLSDFEPYQAHIALVVWRLATEVLHQTPRAEFRGDKLDRVKFASSSWGKDWLVIVTRDKTGVYPEVVGGDLVPIRDWYALENPQGEKNYEHWMQIRQKREPTPQEAAQLYDDLLDLYERLLKQRAK